MTLFKEKRKEQNNHCSGATDLNRFSHEEFMVTAGRLLFVKEKKW